jgi:hypothetical protein
MHDISKQLLFLTIDLNPYSFAAIVADDFTIAYVPEKICSQYYALTNLKRHHITSRHQAQVSSQDGSRAAVWVRIVLSLESGDRVRVDTPHSAVPNPYFAPRRTP